MRVNWWTRRKGADDGVVLHMNVSGELRAVFENDAVADDAIVRDVRVGHDEIVAADARDVAAFVRAAVGGGKFAEFIGVAHFEPGALAVIGEVLRIAADGGERIKMVVAAKSRRAAHHRVVIDNAAVAEFHFVADNGESADSNILS